ncbi:ATP-dependent Lon protease [Alkalithermobacter thermoalcaliphilus JW-YL-7 = DSM 7308]|uniref:Lon protease n=1 Tax=Alkalithermobacter thermoalcaliphilus JW-YL-7 = DSM 7308 TaxID=1121328 RepID=A0A150FRZ9_CLOPD|nr:ATP-dependent protease La [[Clostridium] paradoxum JW-YL-7 = DSM 7308]SHK36431.1 ATP-dependent Lon protease [[Clostridium] paradoxum JW-YL-7 = DSM 7308]
MQSYTFKEHTLPLIPLRGLAVFPYMVIHFDVGREKSINALENAMVDEQLIFLTTQKEAEIDIPTVDDFYHVGTICKIKQMLKLPGDTIRVLVEGISRAKIKEVIQEDPYYKVTIQEAVYDKIEIDKELQALMRTVLDTFEEYINIGNKISPEILLALSDMEDPNRFVDTMCANILLKPSQKQEILEIFDPKERLEKIYKILLEEIEVLEIEKRISIRVKKQINKVQKEYYLREQLKAIQRELGEDEETLDEIEEYKNKLKKLKLKPEIKEKISKEIDRLSRMSPSSAEGVVVRNYIDTIFSLPWDKETKEKLDIKEGRKILDEDHYGLEKVKERILEYLAIRKLSKSMKGPILCLVGPPGVGKTSIAKSIARALNRKFVRVSLGGVRDEAEIRGHRRTYVGAIPGRIINAIKEVGSKNPVLLFDEIDKMASDFRGDPASAMLEVLDPEQNKEFTDHYLEIPFDLSKVLFVTTANSLSTIPRPLLDRMEVIDISGYTEEEKVKIATRYLLPKQIKEHGLKEDFLKISEETIKDIISYYTRESGVRNLERKIGQVCRKAATRYVENPNLKMIRINKSNLEKYLGKPIFKFQLAKEKPEIGIVTGLAWTPVGGDTLSIEVTCMKGTGKLVLTGQLGDVMKESAQAGISYIRSNCNKYDIDPNFYKEMDIHIHIPEGAIPKDGPSAGITMCSAVISALSQIPANNLVAMTGEVTLRGRVLAVGGIKEKVLAAYRAGIKKVLLPEENKRDLEEIPENVRKNMEFVLVESMDQVLEHVLVRNGEKNEN